MAPKRTGEYRECAHCAARFYARPSDDRRHPRRFCSIECRNATYRGEGNPNWRGGFTIGSSGYRLVWLPDHPYADHHGYYEEHRHVVEQRIGRILDPAECVHHLNHDRLDNRDANLQLMASWAEHQTAHGEYETHQCGECGAPVRRSKAHRRRWERAYCTRTCAAAAGSRAAQKASTR